MNYVSAIILDKMLWNIITFVLNFWCETVPRQTFRLKLGMLDQVAKSLKKADMVPESPYKVLKIKFENKWEPWQPWLYHLSSVLLNVLFRFFFFRNVMPARPKGKTPGRSTRKSSRYMNCEYLNAKNSSCSTPANTGR